MKFKILSLLILLLSVGALASESIMYPVQPGSNMYSTLTNGATVPALLIYGSDGTGALKSIFGSGGGLSTSAAPNTSASFASSTSVGASVVTFSPPANAVGFVLEAPSSNAQNLRWTVVTVPTTSSGMRLEPGRDTGYIPVAANVKVIAETGSSQEAEVQWILSQ